MGLARSRPARASGRISSFLNTILVGFAFLATTELSAVVINEIHYNPRDGATLEFVELHNPDTADVSIAGWSFSNGIAFHFPEGATIPAGGFAVVCKDRAAASDYYRLPLEELYGDYEGRLDNNGETLTLVDASGTVVDTVRYDNSAPWDPVADGDGGSLQRVCVQFSALHPANWTSGPDAEPTPLAANVVRECPPPGLLPPTIAINEISYHPVGDRDELEEYIELVNTTDAPVDLGGYSFDDGVSFVFERNTVIDPGAFIVVCRNAEHMRTTYGLENAVGDFTGQLSNDGERITLVDNIGGFVDSVRYDQSGDWPAAADGLKYSLEKLIPTAVSDDPASWREAAVKDATQWSTVTLTAESTSTSRIFVYIDEEGEFLIDNFVLEKLDEPGVNLIENGTFEGSIEPWEARGNHETSFAEAGVSPDGSGALHIVSTGRGTGSSNGLRFNFPDDVLVRGELYRLSFEYRYLSGSVGLTVRLSGSTPLRGIYFKVGEGPVFSPGEENGRRLDHLPPFVGRLGRFPQEPKSSDPVWITAFVRGPEPIAAVRLSYSIDTPEEETTVEMFDDGSHMDSQAGDGIYGAELPAQEHNTIVLFRIVAEDSSGLSRQTPLESDPTGYHGYYVNDHQAESPFPVYTLLWNHKTQTIPPGRSGGQLIRSRFNCSTYIPISFAYQGDVYYNVGLRRRGGSVCGDGNVVKPYMKVKFNTGRLFENQRKINLQSQWTDKSLIREFMAWHQFDEVASPWCREYYIRLHFNGEYFGLYCVLEHPDHRYLDRNNLNPDGNLYKATASREERNGTYEKKTNEQDPSMQDLRDFLNAMHDSPTNQLVDFFSTNLDEDRMIDYQLVQTLTNNADYPHKNHYLYHDTDAEKWMVLAWDMDLTYGKRWDGSYGGVLHDRMDTPGNSPWYTCGVLDGGSGNELNSRFFGRAGTWYRRAYIVRLWNAIQEKYTVPFFEERIGFLRDLLFDEQAEDIETWGRSQTWADDRNAPAEFLPNLDRVMDHVTRRRAYLVNYLQTRHKFQGADRLKITEVMYNPPGSDDDAEWLELWNPTGKDIDVSGWSIEGIAYQFPEETTIAENEVFVVARNVAAFRSTYGEDIRVLGGYTGRLDNNGEILRLKDAGPEYPATIDLLRYGTGDDWPLGADGLGYSLELTEVSDTRDNDPGYNWRRSVRPGGSPGDIDGITVPASFYTRGDVDADGAISVTDAIRVLGYLFGGAEEPGCVASMDADATGGVELTDAVFLLSYLFGSEGKSVPSPGPGECEPISTDACRVSNCGGEEGLN